VALLGYAQENIALLGIDKLLAYGHNPLRKKNKMSKLICPHCGTPAASTPIFLSRHDIFDYVTGTEEAAGNPKVIKAEMSRFHNGTRYAILCCQNCDGYFIAMETYASDGWFSVYPILRRPVSKDILQPIRGEFEEASLCFAVGAYRACATMCQRALESVCQDKKVSGLNKLYANGIISETLFNKATEIRLWAGIVKHKPISESVSKKDAEQLLTYLEVILNDVYIEPKRLATLGQKRQRIKKKPAS